METAIAVAIIVLALLGKPLLALSKRAYFVLAVMLPRASSVGGIFTASVELPLWKVAALVVAFAMLGQRGCELPKVPGDWKLPSFPSILVPAKVTAVTYVHDEKAAIPSGVLAAIAEINTRGIIASNFPDDATDGDDQVPDQYKVTLPVAKAVGIPSLVVQAGDKVLRTVKAPTTKQQVLEAVP